MTDSGYIHPAYWKELKPNALRRMTNHDYKSRCIYMITLNKAPDIPALSTIEGDASDILHPSYARRTPAGSLIETGFNLLRRLHPQVSILNSVIMPDHLHFILFVREAGEHLGQIIRTFKRSCTTSYARMTGMPEDSSSKPSFFTEGYHDRILRGRGQLECMHRYINDNPRRHLIRRSSPFLFTTRHRIVYAGKEYELLGNPYLLHNPQREAVIVSRRHTPERRHGLGMLWRRTIAEKGVLVSPFIHPSEREIMRLAAELGGNIIRICDNGFGERFKPSGHEFDLCAAGRLLLVAPVVHSRSRIVMTRAQALASNDLARHIATSDFSYLEAAKI